VGMAKHPILITEKCAALHSSKGIQLMPTEWTRKQLPILITSIHRMPKRSSKE
jgi:hypothetical protein